jgi:hypothetical protein
VASTFGMATGDRGISIEETPLAGLLPRITRGPAKT